MRHAARAVLAVLVFLVLSGCGVTVQEEPVRISIPEPPATDTTPATGSGGRDVTVFFVRGARLEPAVRSTERPSVGAVLELLAAGPTRAEVIGGLRTALAPQPLVPEPMAATDTVATIEVGREFTDVAGGNQLLAVAQVVWTVTQVPGVDLVRVTAEGQPVEVPTDEGLTDQPVGRSDYRSVAPQGEQSPSGPPEPAPSPSPTDPVPSPVPTEPAPSPAPMEPAPTSR